MKILVNAFSARLGGGQTYLHNLFARLPTQPDLQVLMFAPSSVQLPADARLRRLHTRWPTTNPLLRALWERFVLPGVLRRERVDVLFCPGGAVSTRVPAGCKVATMFRNMVPFDAQLVARHPWGWQKLRNLLLRRVLLRSMVEADLTIFISAHARALIERLAPVAGAVTIPHGIGSDFRTHGRTLARPAAAPPGEYLLYVSRFDLYKHHAEVVRAYAMLPAALRARHPLLLIGEKNPPEAARVAALVQELGLQSQVHMPGAVPYVELPAYYRHAFTVLFASSCENCPNILLEALGAGRPVLSSVVMPMPEFGGDGLVYFSPFDPASIAHALRSVLEHPEEAARVAAAALARSERYDWAATAEQTWQALYALAGPRACQCVAIEGVASTHVGARSP